MGIPGLTNALSPHANLAPLSGESVVVDGPALVYTIWESIMYNQPLPSALVGHVPYSALEQGLISWLDKLRASGVHVRKIYFDGYLPPRKWPVRQERVLKQSQDLKKWAALCRKPLEKRRMSSTAMAESKLALNHKRLYKSLKNLPRHPFLVPSALEALRNSHDWVSVVQVIPGEADAFCAQDVRERGGSVLTSDSDLLIEDLGSHGSVVLFWDLTETQEKDSTVILAKKFFRREIEAKLEIQGDGGLPRVAFEISIAGGSLGEALQRIRQGMSPDREYSFQAFLTEHLPEEYIATDHPVVSLITMLDPRISELVIQCLKLDVMKQANPPSVKRGLRGPEELSMYLPVLVESYEKKSSWTMSETVRELAYGLAIHSGPHCYDRIIEYRTVQNTSGGRQLLVPHSIKVDGWCEQLVETLAQIENGLQIPSLKWLAFAVYQDVQWSRSEQRSPLSVEIINHAVSRKGDIDEYSWDLIHFTSQIQAAFYSLRILKQVLDVAAALSWAKLPEYRRRLRSSLDELPSLANYPTVEGIGSLLYQFEQAKGLAAVSHALGGPRITLNKRARHRSERKTAKGHVTQTGKTNGDRRRTIQSSTVNPFALLSEEMQD
ncbi:XPG domain containing-domain-containing protein [Xylariales sp. PMI_506]|nr:XPG domain containing-domain-containing protein [Xylariales sp. PMI_506]